jgi:hypothetical protein
MKRSDKATNILYLLPLAFIVVLTGLMSCKDDDPSPQEKATNLLTSSTWKIKTVSVDATDRTSLYPGLTLTFTATGYTTTNGGVIWPADGTWSFKDQSATVITRSDGLEITIQELSETSLKLAFTWAKTTLGSGRVQSVSGQHVMTFSK